MMSRTDVQFVKARFILAIYDNGIIPENTILTINCPVCTENKYNAFTFPN